MVEGPEESGLTGMESTGPLKSQETEPSMEVDMDDIPPLTSGDCTMLFAGFVVSYFIMPVVCAGLGEVL